jgi:hypothetical protein
MNFMIASMRRATPAALSKLHSLWRVLLLRMALVVTLGLLTAAALLVAAAFNNELAWLLTLSLVAGLIPVFSAVAGGIDADERIAGSREPPPPQAAGSPRARCPQPPMAKNLVGRATNSMT